MSLSVSKLFKFSILITAFVFFSQTSFAQHEEGKEQPIGDVILHHIADSHEWHILSIGHTHFTIPLPVILYSDNGLDIFSSSVLHHPEKTIEKTNAKTKKKEMGVLIKTSKGEYEFFHEHFYQINGKSVKDFSISKNVASMFFSVLVLLLVFTSVARSYSKTGKNSAPKGMQSFFEPIIVFIRDEVARPNIGEKHYEKFMPYLLTLFFFIWFNNLLGLMPGGANLTGNISITFGLALLTLIITLFSSKGTYWHHIFAPPAPKWLYPIIIPIEIIGILTKPFSLMVRLFANITAGHIIILSLISLIFIFKSIFVSVASIPFAVAMNALELFVAILQAYVFTLLSSMYFGSAVEEHHHPKDDVATV